MIEDLCHTHVSHNWLSLFVACAGSVLTPHDCITNVQKTLDNPAYTGFGQCRPRGTFLDPQIEHGEISRTVEANRGHYACVHDVLGSLRLRDPGITTDPKDSQKRLADLFNKCCFSRTQRGSGRVCGILQGSSRGDAAQTVFDRNISHNRRETPAFLLKASSIALKCGQRMGDHWGQQRSAKPQHRWKHEIHIPGRHDTGSLSSYINQQGQDGFSRPASTTACRRRRRRGRRRRNRQQYQMMTMATSLRSPFNKPRPSRPQTCDRCSRLYQQPGGA